MAQFMLMLNHAPDRYQGLSADDYMEIIKDYVDWVERQAAAGVYVSGEKLADAPGKTLTVSDDGIEVHDSPFAELPEVLGGYMIIEAPDFASAVEIARGHPHLVHNTALHIREIHKVD